MSERALSSKLWAVRRTLWRAAHPAPGLFAALSVAEARVESVNPVLLPEDWSPFDVIVRHEVDVTSAAAVVAPSMRSSATDAPPWPSAQAPTRSLAWSPATPGGIAAAARSVASDAQSPTATGHAARGVELDPADIPAAAPLAANVGEAGTRDNRWDRGPAESASGPGRRGDRPQTTDRESTATAPGRPDSVAATTLPGAAARRRVVLHGDAIDADTNIGGDLQRTLAQLQGAIGTPVPAVPTNAPGLSSTAVAARSRTDAHAGPGAKVAATSPRAPELFRPGDAARAPVSAATAPSIDKPGSGVDHIVGTGDALPASGIAGVPPVHAVMERIACLSGRLLWAGGAAAGSAAVGTAPRGETATPQASAGQVGLAGPWSPSADNGRPITPSRPYPGMPQPPTLADPEVLAGLINDALVEQAQRHGVDLS